MRNNFCILHENNSGPVRLFSEGTFIWFDILYIFIKSSQERPMNFDYIKLEMHSDWLIELIDEKIHITLKTVNYHFFIK
jgi:hypothetical protein